VDTNRPFQFQKRSQLFIGVYTSCLLSFALNRAMLPVNAICRLIAVSLAAALTGCGTSAFYVPSANLRTAFNDYTVGYAFTVSSPIRVTDLGVWDEGSDGLVDPHAVGIWTSTGTQLVQTTIPAGTPGRLNTDGFRYVPIAPFILAPGTYTIGAHYKAQRNTPSADGVLTSATIFRAYEVSYLGPRSIGPGWGFKFPPDNHLGYDRDFRDSGFFGPNFWFTCGDPTQPPTLCRPNR